MARAKIPYERVKTTVRIRKELHEQLIQYSKDNEISLQDVIENCLCKLIQKENKKKAKNKGVANGNV